MHLRQTATSKGESIKKEKDRETIVIKETKNFIFPPKKYPRHELIIVIYIKNL